MRNVQSLQSAMFLLALVALTPQRGFAQHACDEHPLIPAPAGGWSAPLDMRVSLHVRDVSLRDALDRLTAVSKVQLAYSADFLPVDRRVCISADGEPLGSLLATLLRGTPVQVLVVAGRVVLSPGAAPTPAAEATSHTVSVLERVVVTGNAVAAPRRPLVIGVEVIDGEQLRRQSLGSMSELLNASVPGVWSWSQSPSSLVAQYGGIRGASSFGSSSPKIYIDGVEVANPLLVTQLNPDVVDHVEVIRGPQGSALYGSDAISGVINVLTRHDGGAYPAPSISVRSTAGAAGSAFASGLVPTHEQRLNVRAGTNVRSAGLAVAFGQTGRSLSVVGDAAGRGDGRRAARHVERNAHDVRPPVRQAFRHRTESAVERHSSRCADHGGGRRARHYHPADERCDAVGAAVHAVHECRVRDGRSLDALGSCRRRWLPPQ